MRKMAACSLTPAKYEEFAKACLNEILYGGIIAFTDALGKPATALEWDMKLWWPRNEEIIANRMAYELFGEEKYREQYESLLEYAFEHFLDREYGEWYGYLHYDNTPSTELKGNILKGPFHLPRMLMLLHLTDEVSSDDLRKGIIKNESIFNDRSVKYGRQREYVRR